MASSGMTIRDWASLGRSLPGVAALIFSVWGSPLAAAVCLVLAVWIDVIVSWWARRAGRAQTELGISIENLADCVCFVAAPAAFALSGCMDRRIAAPLFVFALAGIFRLARFQLEGLVHGGYRGLPVTYNGYLFPALALILFHWPLWNSLLVWGPFLLIVSALMVSKFVVPEM